MHPWPAPSQALHWTHTYLIQLERDEDAQCPRNPEWAVGEEENLSPAFPRICAEPKIGAFACANTRDLSYEAEVVIQGCFLI